MSRPGESCTVGVDVGGTKIAAGLVGSDGRVKQLTRVPTPSGEAVTDAILAAVKPLLEGGDAVAVGLSIAGFVRADSRTVVFTPNIEDWQPGDLAGVLEARLGRPAVVENDANCAAWGEAVFGAGRGSRAMACLTVGTGLGGGLVVDGQLMRGHSGFAAEFGHMVVVRDGWPCGCGGLGCWEQYVSGRALLRAYHELADLPSDRERPSVTGVEVTQLARQGAPAALGAFAAVGDSLGRGMAVLTAALDPDLFVVGGGVADAGELLLGPTRQAYATEVAPYSRFRPPARIAAGELGGQAGVIGAADLARRNAQGGRHHGG